MRSARTALALSVVALVVTASSPVQAKGSSLEFDQRYLAVGHIVKGRERFWTWRSQGTGGIKDGPYQAYLLPGNTWIRPPRISGEAIPLGRLRILDRHPQDLRATARLTFTVPNVAPGDYSIDFCNDPCTESTIGDLYGSVVQIVATPLEARLAAERDRYERKLDRVEGRLEQRMNQFLRGWERLGEMRSAQEVLTDRVSELEGQLEAVRRETEQTSGASQGWWLVGWAALIGLGVILARRRRSGRTAELAEGRVQLGRHPPAEQSPGHGVQQATGGRRVQDGASGAR